MPGIYVVEVTGLQQRVGDRRPLATAIAAAVKLRLAPERHTAQRSFGCVVREANPAVVEKTGERAPAAQHVVAALARSWLREIRASCAFSHSWSSAISGVLNS